jgi:hypothetical protein
VLLDDDSAGPPPVVIGRRLKQSGMFWTVSGANAIIALRCHQVSRKFEDYRASRSRAA